MRVPCQHAPIFLAGLLSQADVTFALIIGSFREPLNPFLNPVLDAATSADDFDLRDVRRKRMTIELVILHNTSPVSRFIMRLRFNQPACARLSTLETEI